MSFIDHYSKLFFRGTIGAYIAFGVLGCLVLVAFFQALLGFARGTSRSLTRLITVLASAVFAFLGTRIIGCAMIQDKPFSVKILSKIDVLSPVLEASRAEVLLPFVFVILFLLFSAITLIPHKLLCGILGFSYKRNNMLTRLFGAVIGAAHGIVTTAILVFPLFCLIGHYTDVVKAPETKSAVVSFYQNYLEDTEKSPLFEYEMRYGGDILFDEFSRSHK